MIEILRLQKYKRSAVYGISLERNRTKNDERHFAYSDIDKDRTEFNYDYVKTDNWNKAITERLKKENIKERQDSVVMLGVLVTASPEFFTPNPNYVEKPNGEDNRTFGQRQKWLQDKKTQSYFDMSLQFIIDEFCGGDKSLLLSARIDYDEKTPHLQVYLIPLVKGEDKKGELKVRLSAKDLVGNRTDLREHQNSFYEQVGKSHGLGRGEKVDWDSSLEERKRHKETIDYKKEQKRELEKKIDELQEDIKMLTNGKKVVERFDNFLQDMIDGAKRFIKTDTESKILRRIPEQKPSLFNKNGVAARVEVYESDWVESQTRHYAPVVANTMERCSIDMQSRFEDVGELANSVAMKERMREMEVRHAKELNREKYRDKCYKAILQKYSNLSPEYVQSILDEMMKYYDKPMEIDELDREEEIEREHERDFREF